MSLDIGFASDLGVSPELIQKFYQNEWKRKIALSDNNFYSWQFINPPKNEKKDSCVVAIRKGKILGVMGLNKRDFILSNILYSGAELTTWVVAEDNLKGGVGAKILHFILKKFDVLIGMGISEDALSIYLRSGFRYLNSIPRFVKIIAAEKMLQLSDCTDYAKKIIKKKLTEPEKYSYEMLSWRNEKSAPSISGNHFVRNLDHLIWRYEDHPYFDYKTFKVKLPSKQSEYIYVVLREEVTQDIRIIHIIDILGDESGYLTALKFAEFYAIENFFWAVDCFSTFGGLNKYLISQGWLSCVDDFYISVPYLFHPLEIRNPPTTSLIYWSRHNFDDMCDISQLYITKQDADLDRPTIFNIGDAKLKT